MGRASYGMEYKPLIPVAIGVRGLFFYLKGRLLTLSIKIGCWDREAFLI